MPESCSRRARRQTPAALQPARLRCSRTRRAIHGRSSPPRRALLPSCTTFTTAVRRWPTPMAGPATMCSVPTWQASFALRKRCARLVSSDTDAMTSCTKEKGLARMSSQPLFQISEASVRRTARQDHDAGADLDAIEQILDVLVQHSDAAGRDELADR